MSKVEDDRYPSYFDLVFIQKMHISKCIVSHKYARISHLNKKISSTESSARLLSSSLFNSDPHFYQEALPPNSCPEKRHLRANCLNRELCRHNPSHIQTTQEFMFDWQFENTDPQGREITVVKAEDHVTLEVRNDSGDMEWKGRDLGREEENRKSVEL